MIPELARYSQEASRVVTERTAAIPDMSGKVITVAGAVDPAALGQTLMHEHLFLDLRQNHLPHLKMVPVEGRSQPLLTSEEFPATELAVWEAKVDFGNLDQARREAPIADNYILSDEGLAVREVLEFKDRGGSTIVDVTSIGFKRDPEALLRVSNASGLKIVMGTGYYQKVFHPLDMDSRSVEELTAVIVRDVTVGVGDTGIRSGIIGEIGVQGSPVTTNDIKSVRAAARAGVLTGAAVSFHKGGDGRERFQVLDVYAEEGGDMSRAIMGHSDFMAHDVSLVLEVAGRGVYIQFDLIGRAEDLGESFASVDARAILALVEAGYEDRILLSHDVCWKVHLKRYGGFGYSFILEHFLPYLLEAGVTPDQVRKFMVDNPARILPFVAPRSL
jgi:phosphotriesterase-related protein